MGRSSDNEMKTMSRCVREIEKLSDPHSRTRVAAYISMRFTRSIEQLVPVGTPASETPGGIVETGVRPPPATGPVPAPIDDSGPSGGVLATDSGDPPEGGWDVSGKGSKSDDDKDDKDGNDEEVVSI